MAVVIVIWFTIDPLEPERCSICSFIKSHAPCLVNLATGEIGELDLYQPHYSLVGELAENQWGGTFSFFYAAGCEGIKLTNPWELTIGVPAKVQKIQKSYFCQECREMLKDQSAGYALIDLYDKENPKLYPIYDGASYQIRCYSVLVQEKCVREEYEIRIIGTLDIIS